MSNPTKPEVWAYFDCFAGISGDMTLGAMLDAGLDPGALEEALRGLSLPGFRLRVQRVTKEHLTGLKVDFDFHHPQPPRNYPDIVELISRSGLPTAVKERSLEMFRLLAEAEARIHGVLLEEVHFHELGGADTLADVVGVAFGVEALGITRTFVSPVPQGRGMIATAHGRLPNPPPAALELLRGLALYATDLPGELVTPTGAVILRALKAECESFPPMILKRVGYGAGSRELPGHPNLLRLYLGEPLPPSRGVRERVLVLETHIDDMTPELYEPLMTSLFAAGALDVALAPIQMKKNRPGVRLTVVAPPAVREALLERLFLESTTLGVRIQEVERVAARRWQDTITTPYGELRVKVMEYGGHKRVLPEYEACRELAAKAGVPLLEIYRLVQGW